MIYLTQENDLNLNHKFACLYFYASWMPFHKKMHTMISKIEDKYKEYDIVFYAIDIDFHKSFLKRFSVESIPTIVIHANNKEVNRTCGIMMTSAFKSLFADIFKKKM
jgi:thioredoxin-like negative regulator of GroEL